MSAASARVDELKKRYEENPRRFFAPLANEYRKAGELDAAIDLCRMHLDEQPGHLSGHIVYGQALYESGRAGEAKIAFEAALNLDPENLIALRHLGDIGKTEGDVAVAIHWYQRVLEADPRNDEVIALIADLQQPPPAPSVVVVAEPPAAARPRFGRDELPAEDLPLGASSAPTPVIHRGGHSVPGRLGPRRRVCRGNVLDAPSDPPPMFRIEAPSATPIGPPAGARRPHRAPALADGPRPRPARKCSAGRPTRRPGATVPLATLVPRCHRRQSGPSHRSLPVRRHVSRSRAPRSTCSTSQAAAGRRRNEPRPSRRPPIRHSRGTTRRSTSNCPRRRRPSPGRQRIGVRRGD